MTDSIDMTIKKAMERMDKQLLRKSGRIGGPSYQAPEARAMFAPRPSLYPPDPWRPVSTPCQCPGIP